MLVLRSLLFSVVAIATQGFADHCYAQERLSFLVARPGPVQVTAGVITSGQTIVSLPVQHGRVGRLQNDIRGTGLVNSDRIVVPKGTPVYMAAFSNQYSSIQGWCGVVTGQSGNRLGYCMFPDKKGDGLGKLPSNNSFYTPNRLADYGLRPIDAAVVADDPTVRNELPPIELRIAFDKWTPTAALLGQIVVVEGKEQRYGSVNVDRAADGSATFQRSGGAIKLTPTADEKGANVEITTPFPQ